MNALLSRAVVLRRVAAALTAATALFACVGCMSWGPRKADRTSSIVEFLYPGATNPLAPMDIPTLRLPLRVGIAFVPNNSGAHGQHYHAGASTISEREKALLLERVAQSFRGRDYIGAIEIIPAGYLRAEGGFENLEQIRRMLNIDVVALVSYDQVQFTKENRLSLMYWTVVGAYFFKGNENDTQTLMEASVFDIASRQLLFRAPGAASVQASTTLLQVNDRLRHDSARSLQIATDDLILNLQKQLDDFRERARQAPNTIVKIERRPGYTGAGDFKPWYVLVVLALSVVAVRHSRRA
jgi:rhombotail lipoprotein